MIEYGISFYNDIADSPVCDVIWGRNRVEKHGEEAEREKFLV